jgi:formamidopyrimidine-DNA glycosylase
MPELPDVDAARLIATRVATGRRIVDAQCADDRIVYDRVDPQRFRRALIGRRVLGAHRRGKHLWLELDRRPWPCFHFGMTGGFHIPTAPGPKLVSSRIKSRGTEWPPRFTKLRLFFDDGGELVMSDPRRLGRIRLRQDPAKEPPISLLGFDALLEIPSARELRQLLATRSGPIKAVLLDQGFSAGVGNWIADEVLYQARIDPRRSGSSLTADEVNRLRARLRYVMTTAVRARSDSRRFPRWWLFHARWDRDVSVRGEKLRRATIGGRTTAWAPAVQK